LYGIAELAALGGVSRRTVRYYVQEGLLPQPLGVGRGDHYGPAHLTQLLRVKGLQEQGRSLEEIRRLLAPPRPTEAGAEPERVAEVPRTLWRRVELLPGVELHVSSDWRLPSAVRLMELKALCRQLFRQRQEKDDD